jgi:hypothetical protein
MDTDDRTWLRNPDTGGYFHCPNGAVDHWKALGWQPVDEPPQDVNPAVAELVAWRAAQAAEAATDQPDEQATEQATEQPATPTTKPRRGTTTDTKE